MTEVNIKTMSYDEWQKIMLNALKNLGVEQWVGYEKPGEVERLALDIFFKLKEEMDAGRG